MRATRTFTDEKKKLRKNGEEWLITFTDTETYIPNVSEEVNATIILFCYLDGRFLWTNIIVILYIQLRMFCALVVKEEP